MTPEKGSRVRRSARARQKRFPFLWWATVYYAGLFLLFVLLFRPWLEDFSKRQLPGLWRTAEATLILIVYLVLAALPALEWTRRGYFSSAVTRGIEAYVVFLVVFLSGWAMARVLGSEVDLLSVLGLLKGRLWAMGGALMLFFSFLLFSFIGSRMSTKGRSRRRSKG